MIKQEMEEYCLNCKNKPCQASCPLGNNIPEFIHEKDMENAYQILLKTTVLPAICGRICPHTKQCQGSCVRGIKGNPVSIGNVEKEIADKALEENYEIKKDDNYITQKCNQLNNNMNLEDIKNILKLKKVAVIGSGPAGLTCAAFLARNEVNVTIYEKDKKLGGILSHGIPEFRLSSEIVQDNIEKIISIGVEYKTGMQLGKDITIEGLLQKYDAIFIGIGSNISASANINGETLNGVYGANELLEDKNYPDFTGKNVSVLGGGNVAMDAARTIKRLNANEVNVIYRRAEEQMPAEPKEIESAKKEGINFMFQSNIVNIMGENKVEDIECIRTELVKKDGEKRLVPVEIKGSNYVIPMDYVIIATGSKPDDKVIFEFEKNSWGYIKVKDNMETSINRVFAGGDIIGEKATVAWASRSGRNAAYNIIDELLK